MNETNTLILAGEGYQLAIAPEAEAAKAELIKHASLIVEVSDPNVAEAAKTQIKKLAAMRNLVEKSRTTVKAPVLQVGKDIDAKAAEFVAEIKQEEGRISKMVEDYAEIVERERRKIMREMEEKRQAEEKARREAEEAKAKAEREAEAARIAAEKAEWEGSEEAQAAARKLEEEAARKAEEAKQAAAKIEEQPKEVFVAPAATSGVKFEYDFEVESIDALYRFNPSLVKMEAERAEVMDYIKRQAADGNMPVIPGLKITQKAKVLTR